MFPGKEIENVIGGYHLNKKTEKEVKNISDQLVELEVKKISPSHCTGKATIETLRKLWGNKFQRLYLGDEYNF